MSFLLSQIIGVITLLITLVIVHFKEVRQVLIGQVVSNLLFAVGYLLVGGFSGALVCLFASVQAVIIYKIRQREDGGPWIIKLAWSFSFIYLAGTVLTYQGWQDIISFLCSVLYVLSLVQKSTKRMRMVIGMNMVLWIIYDYQSTAYAQILTHGLTFLSVTAAQILQTAGNDGGKPAADKGGYLE